MFLGRRERVMKGGWRHGITGIDDADSPKASIFFSEQRDAKLAEQAKKDQINQHRTKIVAMGMGTSN